MSSYDVRYVSIVHPHHHQVSTYRSTGEEDGLSFEDKFGVESVVERHNFGEFKATLATDGVERVAAADRVGADRDGGLGDGAAARDMGAVDLEGGGGEKGARRGEGEGVKRSGIWGEGGAKLREIWVVEPIFIIVYAI